ncbi:hypothetical protein B0A52_01882 [Exophiala mesophila]|uniref:Cyclin-D1-binding protein 1-like N-terminal domain-containing protein n=1 Tax=Exophiala mesophila TaxID=212818 RepID=A0A438NEA2_EXOME|nr:hypothetical protein B0A52_01882 [Exophiala mesophila]
MAASPTSSLDSVLSTSLTLCERFISSLSPDGRADLPAEVPEAPSPLPLLTAAATALRAQVTKISLLAITTPFTPSALITCILPLNESILTSLVTAALLITPRTLTLAYSSDCRYSTTSALKELQGLLRLVHKRGQNKDPKTEVSESEKKSFTEATGRVWDSCDKLNALAAEDVPGYVVRKTKQWLELMKDAVKELEEWDPEEEFDRDDPFGQDFSDDDTPPDSEEKNDENDRAAISAGVKDQALKVLSRIPQSIHVVIKQRLEKSKPSPKLSAERITQLGTIMTQTRQISELIDESAEGMYLGDLELCLKKAGEARAVTMQVVELVVPSDSDEETKEDKYIKRALEWIHQVDTRRGSSSAKASNEGAKT